MALTIPASIAARWPDQAAAFPPNAEYTDDTAIIWADAGAREAADKANAALAAVNVLSVKLDEIIAELKSLPVVAASTDAIAAAVVARMAKDMQNG